WSVRDRVAREQRLTTQVELILVDVDRLEQEQKWFEATVAIKVAEAVLNSSEADDAMQRNHSRFAILLDQLRHVPSTLVPPLVEIYRNKERPDSERSFVANILTYYVADQPHLLADLLMDADAKQFLLFYPKLKEHGADGLASLENELGKRPDLVVGPKEREKL